MNPETLLLLAGGIAALIAFGHQFARLERLEERVAETRLRLWAWAELERDNERLVGVLRALDGADVARVRQLEALFPEILSDVAATGERKDVSQ